MHSFSTSQQKTTLLDRLKKQTDDSEQNKLDEHDYLQQRVKKKELLMAAKHKLLLPPTVIEINLKQRFVIHEANKYKFVWDLWTLANVLYIAFVVPYRLCFDLPDV
jgi:hypothetical protein